MAISIPIFTSQLEKSREATDLANIRSAYAEIMVKALENPEKADITQTYTLKQVVDGWATTDADATLKKLAGNDSYVTGSPVKTKGVTLTWIPATSGVDGHITIAFDSAS